MSLDLRQYRDSALVQDLHLCFRTKSGNTPDALAVEVNRFIQEAKKRPEMEALTVFTELMYRRCMLI